MIALFVASFFSLLLGTYLWAFRLSTWDGGLFVVLGLLGLILAQVRVLRPAWRGALFFAEREDVVRIRFWLRSGALFLAAWVGLTARHRPETHDFTGLLLLWLLAVCGFIVSLYLPWKKPSKWPWRVFNRDQSIGLAALLLVALLLRVAALGRIPANLGGDEGTQALYAFELMARPLGNPFKAGWYSVPTMSFLFYGFAMRLFGTTISGVRLLSALVGTATVLFTFLLGREIEGRWTGWIAALLVTFSAYHIHFSRLASNQIFDPFIGTLSFWLIWRALHMAPRSRANTLWGLAGLVMGLGWYTYFGARWVTFMAGLLLAWRALVEPRFVARHWRGLLLLLGGWLVAALPLLMWYTAHPSDLTARYNAVSIFASGWLTQEASITGRSIFSLLLQQFWKAFTAFHLTPDPTFWYYPEAPLLDFVSGAFFLLGLVVAFFKCSWPSRGFALLWFLSTVAMAWGVTENPPSSQRGTLLIPIVAIITAWGVAYFEEFLKHYRPLVMRSIVALITLICLLNLVFYFGIYTPRRSYGNPTAEAATEFARFALDVPLADSTTYFFGAPYLYWDFGSLAFLLRDQAGVDVAPDSQVDGVRGPARFVFVPERIEEFAAVSKAYPGGDITKLHSPEGRFLMLVYDWYDTQSP